MSKEKELNYSRIEVSEDDNAIDITVPKELKEEFKKMVERALHTWQDASPQMRDFSDRLHKKEHIMGRNMKWELPTEDQYELAKYRVERRKSEQMRPISAHRCPECLELPCICASNTDVQHETLGTNNH